MSVYTVQIIQRSDGENHPVLLSDGRPLVLPNLWGEELARSLRFNTVRAYLKDLVELYEGMGRGGRGSRSDGLCEIVQATEKGHRVPKRLLRRLSGLIAKKRSGAPAALATQQRRVESTRSFLRFVSDSALDARDHADLEVQVQIERNVERTLRAISKLTQSGRNEAPAPNPATTLSGELLQVVSGVMHPDSKENPFETHAIRVRNYCLFHVVIQTFCRRGELVLLETSDLLSNPPRLRFRVPSRSNVNKRKDGASLKTLGREIEIESALWGWLSYFLAEVRDELLHPGVPVTALFVSTSDGRRLGAGTVNQILERVHRVPVVANVIKRMHPHGLRVTGTNNFRRRASSASPPLSRIDLQDSLTMMAGWSPDSKMPRRYTREAIAERLGSIDLSVIKPANLRRA